MAELQQSVVTDQDTRHQIQTQILQWEENLERLHCEQFRLRCYMASLQGGELPNPKVCTKSFLFFHIIYFFYIHILFLLKSSKLNFDSSLKSGYSYLNICAQFHQRIESVLSF